MTASSGRASGTPHNDPGHPNLLDWQEDPMTRAAFASLVCLLGLACPAAPDDKKDNEPFQGKWKIVSIDINGEAVPAEQFRGAVLTVAGDERVLQEGDQVLSRAKYKVDPRKDPKIIDIMV